MGYVQDERYIAIEHMDKVRPGTGREGSLGCVRRDCVNFAQFTELEYKRCVTSYAPYDSGRAVTTHLSGPPGMAASKG